jgi:hypothetical protein
MSHLLSNTTENLLSFSSGAVAALVGVHAVLATWRRLRSGEKKKALPEISAGVAVIAILIAAGSSATDLAGSISLDWTALLAAVGRFVSMSEFSSAAIAMLFISTASSLYHLMQARALPKKGDLETNSE